MAKCHNNTAVVSGLHHPPPPPPLPTAAAAIFLKNDWKNGWDPSVATRVDEEYASSQWNLESSSSSSSSFSSSSSCSSSSSSTSSSPGDAESFLPEKEKQSPDYHSYDPWQASEPMARSYYSSMMIGGGGELTPPQEGQEGQEGQEEAAIFFPRQALTCPPSYPHPYPSTSFALPAQFFSFSPPPRMELESSSSSSYDETAPIFETSSISPALQSSSSPTSFNTGADRTTSFDRSCGPHGPLFDSSDSSEASYGSSTKSPFESYYPYHSPPFISSSPSHDSSDQDFAASPPILNHLAGEPSDGHFSASFLYNDGILSLSQNHKNTQLDDLSRWCQGEAEPGYYSTGNGYHQTYGQSSHIAAAPAAPAPPPSAPARLKIMPVEQRPGATKPKKVLKKPYACFPCNKGFERHEHLTRHKLTMTHRKTLKDQGIPCYDPPPQMTACPFCPRKFNRSDNLKPHMLTHMHLAGENKRNTPISIEDSVRSGQAKIDPRLKQMLEAKKECRSGFNCC